MKKIFSILLLLLVFTSLIGQDNEEADESDLQLALLELQEEQKEEREQRAKDSLRNSYNKEFLLNPLSFIVGGFEVGFGVVRQKSNTRLIAGYYFSEAANAYDGDFDNMEGFRLELQHLFTKPVKNDARYYAGPYAVYKSITMDRNASFNQPKRTLSGSAVSFGLMLGVRSFVVDNFFFDFYLGGGPTIGLGNEADEDDVHINIANPYKNGINPRGGITFGIAFKLVFLYCKK